VKLMSGRVGLTSYTIICRVRVTCHNPINKSGRVRVIPVYIIGSVGLTRTRPVNPNCQP
jgi:hypothetical protein